MASRTRIFIPSRKVRLKLARLGLILVLDVKITPIAPVLMLELNEISGTWFDTVTIGELGRKVIFPRINKSIVELFDDSVSRRRKNSPRISFFYG